MVSDPRTTADMVTLYELGYTTADIAVVFYMSQAGVWYCLKNAGVTLRPHHTLHYSKAYRVARRQNAIWLRDHFSRG